MKICRNFRLTIYVCSIILSSFISPTFFFLHSSIQDIIIYALICFSLHSFACACAQCSFVRFSTSAILPQFYSPKNIFFLNSIYLLLYALFSKQLHPNTFSLYVYVYYKSNQTKVILCAQRIRRNLSGKKRLINSKINKLENKEI